MWRVRTSAQQRLKIAPNRLEDRIGAQIPNAGDSLDRNARIRRLGGASVDLGEGTIRFGEEAIHRQVGDKRATAVRARHLGVD